MDNLWQQSLLSKSFKCYTKIEIAGFGKIEIAGYNRILDYNPIKNDREINSYEFKSIY